MIKKHQYVKLECSGSNDYTIRFYRCIYCGKSCFLKKYEIQELSGNIAICDKSEIKGTFFEMFKDSYDCLKKEDNDWKLKKYWSKIMTFICKGI